VFVRIGGDLVNTIAKCLGVSVFLAVFIAAGLPAHGESVLFVEQAGLPQYDLSSGSTGAHELSGLTWAGGSQYYAVSDANATVYPLTVNLNMTTGVVTSAALNTGITLAAGTDLEGIAYDAATGQVTVSDETGPAIRKYSLADGSVTGTVTVPTVYGDYRTNLSLESLSMQASGASLWTCNEEALVGDGPESSSTAPTTVRIQKFDASLSAAGQWAYEADPYVWDWNPAQEYLAQSGVADLCVLPDGKVLVLERELGWMAPMLGPHLRSRIYAVDLTGATDVTSIDNLDGAAFTPVGKRLLWEGVFPTGPMQDFEGIALGPQLDDGQWSLLLISDDAGGTQPLYIGQALFALTLREAIPGDANFDGKIDGADLALWQQHYDPLGTGGDNNTFETGDWNLDGKIDGGDLALWQQNYNPLGTLGGSAPLDAIPEPTTFVLVGLVAAGVIRRGFQRRRTAP